MRKFFKPSHLYTKSADFHVCVTSYQLIVSDDKVFRRLNWQYMILDEAQAIKNVNSQRWNTLLEFNCRNRLLLSGTPIQNSMSELWALLHFIMPNLFDSHEQFQEWFSKDIEAHSQDKGELNQEQLKRLHKILKPFMLRRIKKDVENEIGPKVEYEINCEMTERQKTLYKSIKQKLSNISELFTSVDSRMKVENLMNLVMQFRKVCNHPELFERHIGKVPFIFRDLVLSRSSTVVNTTNVADLRIDTTSCIQYNIPKLVYDNLISFNYRKYSIFVENWQHLKIFNFLPLINMTFGDLLILINNDSFVSQIYLTHYLTNLSKRNTYFNNRLTYDSEQSVCELFPFGQFNKIAYQANIKINNDRKLNLFINSKLYPLTDDMLFLFKRQDPINSCDPLIIHTLSERYQSSILTTFKVNDFNYF